MQESETEAGEDPHGPEAADMGTALAKAAQAASRS